MMPRPHLEMSKPLRKARQLFILIRRSNSHTVILSIFLSVPILWVTSNKLLLRPTKIFFEQILESHQEDEILVNFARNILIAPQLNIPYNLNAPELTNQSRYGLEQKVLAALQNKTAGFFIESGLLDGETNSNTLFLERFFSWQGLLVEADHLHFEALSQKKRKAWSARICLSPRKYPVLVSFTKEAGGNMDICLPLTTLLLALKRNHVDYLSLDEMGSEFQVLQTIDFDKFNIMAITVKQKNLSDRKKPRFKWYMETRGYEQVEEEGWPLSKMDLIFIKKTPQI